MPQIYKDMGIGEKFGTGLGQGLSQGLQQLADIKLKDYLHNQQMSKISKSLESLGYSPQEAQGLAQLDPKVQQAYIKQKMSAPQNQSYANIISSLIGGQTPDLSSAQLNPNQFKDVADFVLKKQQIDATKGAKEKALNLKEEAHKEKISLAKQNAIQKKNEPFRKNLEKAVSLEKDIQGIASEMLKLVNSGKVASGLKGTIQPRLLQNPETQQFESLSNELATRLASRSGTATNFKIKMAQLAKPNLGQKPQTQRALLNDILGKSNKFLDMDRIRQEIIDNNNGNEPENLENMVLKRLHSTKKQLESKVDTAGLPDPKKYTGKGFIENSTGRKIIVSDGKWVYGD